MHFYNSIFYIFWGGFFNVCRNIFVELIKRDKKNSLNKNKVGSGLNSSIAAGLKTD